VVASTANQSGEAMSVELSKRSALIVVDMQNGFCHRDGVITRTGLG